MWVRASFLTDNTSTPLLSGTPTREEATVPLHHPSVRPTHDTTAPTTRPVHYLSPRHVMAVLIGLAIIVWAVVAVVLGSGSSSSRPPASTTNQWVAPGQPTTDATTVYATPTVPATSGEAAVADTTVAPQPEPDPQPEPQPDTTLPEAQPEPQPDPDPEPRGADRPRPAGATARNAAAAVRSGVRRAGGVGAHRRAGVRSRPATRPSQPPRRAAAPTECITFAQAWVWPGTSDIEVEVHTHTPAFIKVYIRTEAPGTMPNGRPYYGGSPTVATTGDLDTWFSTTLRDLDESTKYWILVVATDADVRSSYAVGVVETPQLFDDVQLVFAGIDIIYDGDKGNNKGELTFDWNVGDLELGSNGEYHRGNGSRIDLASQVNSVAQQNLGDEALPPLTVRGLEKDPGTLAFCQTSKGVNGHGHDNDCGYAWNTTDPGVFTIADIEAMSDCGVFEIDEIYDGWQCTRITTSEEGSGMPEFSVVVAFRLY
jgi:hypothetical protein